MEMEVFRLNFKTPVHFGRKRLSDGEMTIAADTLFSALFIETLNLKMDTHWLLDDLRISDTFPYENEIYYLPKPLMKITSQSEGNHKDFKKLKFIPIHHYLDFINGKLTSEDAKDLNEIFYVGKYTLHTKVSLLNQTKDASAESEPFSVGTFSYDDNAGLYFMAKGSEETLAKLKTVLTSLQYSGLGGKRSSGYGRFQLENVQDEKISSIINQTGNLNILLSTAMAKVEELEEITKEARYILQKRSGFIQSSKYAEQLMKKQDFYCFSSGSVFSKKFEGDIFNVGVEGAHPVYRYAKPFWMEV